jgi:hypothetical protein
MKAGDSEPENLLFAPAFAVPAWHRVGMPVPVFSSSLAYYDGRRRKRLPAAALTQGLRDPFGAHTYGRTDAEVTFHTLWSGDKSEVRRSTPTRASLRRTPRTCGGKCKAFGVLDAEWESHSGSLNPSSVSSPVTPLKLAKRD